MTTDVDSQGRRRHRSEATAEAYRPERPPQQALRAAQRAREERVAEAWWRAHALCLALHRAGVGPRSTERRSLALAETALWLAGGATREPGVPIAAQLPLAPSSRLGDRAKSLLEGPSHELNVGVKFTVRPAAELSVRKVINHFRRHL
jgi:hypothetical protein